MDTGEQREGKPSPPISFDNSELAVWLGYKEQNEGGFGHEPATFGAGSEIAEAGFDVNADE